MDTKQSSAIFGLNFLQDMGGKVDAVITGAYDPEQGLWISDGETPAASSGGSGSIGGGGGNAAGGIGRSMNTSSGRTATRCIVSSQTWGADLSIKTDVAFGNDTVSDTGVDFD